ncbi:hypothetical protein FZEAL_6076 [Fusarium zealandicum]|uniref:Uncharacterized protein n=1 Tax=Fusarium zealandicum TaxID=1053134 RepID=A0A8H4UIT7_9HYPO|nr:hypothetical protein FZEAL_6076 [Fusarium zealandicum]
MPAPCARVAIENRKSFSWSDRAFETANLQLSNCRPLGAVHRDGRIEPVPATAVLFQTGLAETPMASCRPSSAEFQNQ